eukprot:gene3159-3437_t
MANASSSKGRAFDATQADMHKKDTGPLSSAQPLPVDLQAIQQQQPCRQGSVVPYTLIEGPDAWYGQQQRQQPQQWLHELTGPELEELEAAVEAVSRRLQLRIQNNYLVGLMKLRDPADFPIPLLAPVLARTARELQTGRGFFLLRGLPVAKWSRQQVLVAYWGLGLHLGVAVPQNQKGHLLGHVKDVGVDPLCENPATRIYMTRAAQPWHVDSCDIVGLLCLQTAKAGGLSSWASSTTIYNELLQQCPQAVAALAGTWYLDRKGELAADKPPFYTMPILHFHKCKDIDRLLSGTRALLLLPWLFRPDVRMDWQLQPGDMQWINNHNIVHTRTQFEDWENPTLKRHLLRLWLVVPGLRPLPAQALQELWGPLAEDHRAVAGLIALEDAELAARFGGSGMGCIPLDAEAGNRLRD